MPGVDRGEALTGWFHRLAVAEKQHAVAAQREEEAIQDGGLGCSIEVDQQVAATDQIGPRKGRIGQHVMASEDDAVADARLHGQRLVVLADQELVILGGHVDQSRHRVAARGRGLERLVVEVRGEDLEVEACAQLADRALHDRCDRVHLFPGRAARDPNAERVAALGIRLNRCANTLFELFEGARVAKEVRDVNQAVLGEPLNLRVVGLQELDVRLRRLQMVQGHATLDASPDRAGLVARQVIAHAHLHELEDALVGLRRRHGRLDVRRFEGTSDQALDQLRDRHRLEHTVDTTRRQRSVRHTIELRAFGGLNDNKSALLLDASHAA